MNVIRATLNKNSNRGRRRRFRNAPIFNTYFAREARDQVSNSDVSTAPQSASVSGQILGAANRNNSSSHSTEPAETLNFAAVLQKKPTSTDPQITNEFLVEAFRTPIVPETTNSSTSKVSSNQQQPLRSLPPPQSTSGGRKQRSTTSSGPRPVSTSSHTHTTRTPRTPKTTSSLESAPQMIVAITEGRGLARGEVGLASLDITRPHLVLCQISDSQTYVNTLTKVNIIHPVEMLVPHTFVESEVESKLFTLLHDNFPQVAITTVQRRHYSDTVGLQQVQSLCLPEYSSVELVVSHKFYALAAAAALLKFTEHSKNIIFTPKSLKIEYQSPENVMAIDMDTAKRLELVMSRSEGELQGSLLGVLDHCCTTSGKRSLRANILQPPTSLELINSRLLSVTELSQNPAFLHNLLSAVSKFTDVEQLLWLCMQMPNIRDELKASEIQTNYVLLLKTSLDSLPMLHESLQSAQTPFFHKVMKDLDDDRFALLQTYILEVINDDARTKKGYAASQFQRCFAIKTGVDGLLDMARSSYSDLVSTTHDKIKDMATEFNLPLRASSTMTKGLHIQLNVGRNSNFSVKELPPVFIQVSRSKNLITCTTEDLAVLNHRMRELLREIQIMSNSILQRLLQRLRSEIGCLYRLCENIAELDLLVALAQVSSSIGFVPPTFGNLLDVKQSRHPILDFISPFTPVANDVFASAEKNFHIITGPNMGGKSVYIKQVALLQVMAQIGCFVPAESAKFKVMKQIFSRMGFDDSIEYNASSFALEMQEMQYILRSLKPNSLVVIDELCRSTDHEEGTAIAWVLCEQLLQSKAFTFFTTHYLFLTRLQTLYPNVTNHQMVTKDDGERQLVYTHKLAPGVTKIMLYGLRLAQVTAIPLPVLQRAREICNDLAQQRMVIPVHTEEKTEAEEDQEYIQELLDLIQEDRFNLKEVVKIQAKLKQRYGIEDEFESQDVQEELNVEDTRAFHEPAVSDRINENNPILGISNEESDKSLLYNKAPGSVGLPKNTPCSNNTLQPCVTNSPLLRDQNRTVDQTPSLVKSKINSPLVTYASRPSIVVKEDHVRSRRSEQIQGRTCATVEITRNSVEPIGEFSSPRLMGTPLSRNTMNSNLQRSYPIEKTATPQREVTFQPNSSRATPCTPLREVSCAGNSMRNSVEPIGEFSSPRLMGTPLSRNTMNSNLQRSYPIEKTATPQREVTFQPNSSRATPCTPLREVSCAGNSMRDNNESFYVENENPIYNSPFRTPIQNLFSENNSQRNVIFGQTSTGPSRDLPHTSMWNSPTMSNHLSYKETHNMRDPTPATYQTNFLHFLASTTPNISGFQDLDENTMKSTLPGPNHDLFLDEEDDDDDDGSVNRLFPESNNHWRNFSPGRTRSMSEEMNNSRCRLKSNEGPSSMPTPLSGRFLPQNQRTQVSSTPMMVDLHPNFESIPRNIGSGDCDDDDGSVNRLFTESNNHWRNFSPDRTRSMTEEMNNSRRRLNSNEGPSSMPTPHSERFLQQNQCSSTPMMVDLHPKFERIPRNIGSRDYRDDDMFKD